MTIKNHWKILIISLVIGFSIAVLTRASIIVFATDLSYFKFYHIEYPQQIEFNPANSGKKVIGISGFPFKKYTDCIMDFHGTTVQPACNSVSLVGEFSIVCNTIFWTLFFYGLLVLALRTRI